MTSDDSIWRHLLPQSKVACLTGSKIHLVEKHDRWYYSEQEFLGALYLSVWLDLIWHISRVCNSKTSNFRLWHEVLPGGVVRYHQKIVSFLTRSSHGLSTVFIQCCEGLWGCILSTLGSSGVVSRSHIVHHLHHHLRLSVSFIVTLLSFLSVGHNQVSFRGHQCCHIGWQWNHGK